MCNIWTNEHVFIWAGGSTTNAEPPPKLKCQCGQYHYDGTRVEDSYFIPDPYVDVKIKAE